MARKEGTGGKDHLIGTSLKDTLVGLGDDDILDGGSSDDALFGGDGSDTLNGGSGNDKIYGFNEDGSDDGSADTIDAGSGNDDVWGGDGDDLIDAGTGNDSVDGGDGNDTIEGGSGNDIITGGLGDDAMSGGTGNDTFIGFVGKDSIDGGTGIDALEIGPGVATDLSAAADGEIKGLEIISAAKAGGAVLINLENQSESFTFIGSGFGDLIKAGSGDDTFVAQVNDVLDGYDGFTNGDRGDTADYSAYKTSLDVNLDGGSAVSVGGSGTTLATSDLIANIENFIGGSADDKISGDGNDNWIEGGGGNDTLDGEGNPGTDPFGDTVSYANAKSGVIVILGGAAAGFGGNGADQGVDSLINFENIEGSNSADALAGDGGDNKFIGYTKGDAIDGQGGTDTIWLTASSNALNSAPDVNISSVEQVDASSAASGVTVNLTNQTENFTITGSAFNDTLTGSKGAGINALIGGDGNDTLTGLTGVDFIQGGTGKDTMTGGGANIDAFFFAQGESFVAGSKLDHVTDYTLADLLLFRGTDVAGGDTGVDNQALGAAPFQTAFSATFFGAGVGYVVQHRGGQAQVYVDTGLDGVFDPNVDIVVRLDTDPGSLAFGAQIGTFL